MGYDVTKTLSDGSRRCLSKRRLGWPSPLCLVSTESSSQLIDSVLLKGSAGKVRQRAVLGSVRSWDIRKQLFFVWVDSH